ncbi:FAD/FMN-containing dehydrogenase [Nocardia transvalensis]|uniref:FAD/FMN-containing dehydrogenase n=1 Tax=Nocardia transvalensis TaxID=37333 RepID=A0A7W9PJE6_9NOCA|nr:FAD-binding oxidoreductase [Nocardia transvalensis]MBB5917121.1 FAD/FMN-containing dehydrogenase [Nocardia transvalensis]
MADRANGSDGITGALPRRSFLLGAGALAAANVAGSGVAGAQEPAATAWDELRERVRGTLVLPGDTTFGPAKALFDPQFDDRAPAGVIRAATADDVTAAIVYARDRGLPIAARAGGHSYVGASATDGALVVDVRNLREVTVDGDLVTVGTGATSFDVLSALDGSGHALPVGTCPDVGLAGLALGGGLGVDSRRYGLTCDRLVSAELVLPTGATARTSADELPGLFWALRGAGGVTGIVTSLTMRTCPATAKDVVRLTFPGEAAARVLTGWAQWMPAADRAVWANVEISATADGLGCAVLVVSDAGAGARAATEIAATAATAPLSVDTRSFAPLDAAVRLGGGASLPRSSKVAGSDVLAQLSPAVAATIVDTVTARSRGGASGYVLIDPLDGAVRDIPADATAFPWRAHAAALQWIVESPDDPGDARRWIADAHRALGPASAGAYVNYVEPGERPDRYYAGNLARVRAVHRSADPDNRLRGGIAF